MPNDRLKVFEIDLTRLEEEWAHHARYYELGAKRLADARNDYERAKVDKELTYADMDHIIRQDPSQFGLTDKVTEPGIKSAILHSPRHVKAQEKVLTTKHIMDVWSAYVSALEQRKSALENEVKLWAGGYFSAPTAPDNMKEHMARKERDVMFAPKKKERTT